MRVRTRIKMVEVEKDKGLFDKCIICGKKFQPTGGTKIKIHRSCYLQNKKSVDAMIREFVLWQ